MTTSRLARLITVGIIGLTFAFGVAIFVKIISSGTVTKEMIKDIGYFRWTHGGPYRPEYVEAFERDYAFQRQFIGKPIASVKPLFPQLHSGATYHKGSYRAVNVSAYFSNYSGKVFENYWLGGEENHFGFCVLVIDGRIRDFIHVKG